MNTQSQWRLATIVVFIVLFLFLVSCASFTGPRYYAHMIFGQTEILIKRTPISFLLSKEETPEKLKTDLREIRKV